MGQPLFQTIYNVLRKEYSTFKDFFEGLDQKEQNAIRRTCFNHQMENILQRLEAIEKIISNLETKNFPEQMTTPEAAKFLSISESKLRELYKSNDIPYIQNKKGGKITFDKADLEKWKEKNKK